MMESFLSKPLELEEGTILKINLKYSITSNKKNELGSDMNLARYSICLLYTSDAADD